MQRIKSGHIPAPTGGINAVDPLGAMPSSDSLLQVNLTSGEQGLRPRPGYQTDGIWSNAAQLRTVVGFSGADTPELFYLTPTKIWKVNADLRGVSESFVFAASSADAGYANATEFTNAAGEHFLLLCDEENGYHEYFRPDPSLFPALRIWKPIVKAATSAWAPLTAYALGDTVTNDGGKTYVCIEAGTSAGAGGPTGVNEAGIFDGTVQWGHCTVVTGADPRDWVSVCQFKSRLWFVEEGTAHAWYLNLGAMTGPATKFDFGSRFPHGGTLVNLYRWTIDGGVGIDDHLVAISSTGDVVVYKGTDPSSADTWAQVGSWFLGGVPAGRRIASEYGGDLLILSPRGVIPLSRLVNGGEVSDPTIYPTAKIGPLFERLYAERHAITGWHVTLHPEDNTLLVVLPDSGADTGQQLAFNLTRKTWSFYEGLPILSSTVWQGNLYFGTADGRICLATGDKDAAKVDGTLGTAIPWSLLTSYQNVGSPAWKRVQSIKPRVAGTAQIAVAARFDYDDAEPSGTVGTPTVTGATGMGSAFAIAATGTSSADCTLIGFDVTWDEGGAV